MWSFVFAQPRRANANTMAHDGVKCTEAVSSPAELRMAIDESSSS